MHNKSFRPDFSNPQQNAVVGSYLTGDRSYAYREGFRQATLVLLAAASAESYMDPVSGEPSSVFVDAIVYPICFNARHFMELFLKDSIRVASAMGFGSPPPKIMDKHVLTDLWECFVEVITHDERLVELGMPIEQGLKDIAQVDDTSLTFRYPNDLKNKAHLEGFEHINLVTLGDELRQMFKQAEDFSVCLEVLQQEYALGTFTVKLHRGNLEEIARRLPSHEKWALELEPIKKEICEEFELSSNDFSKALALIKRHRKFSSLIGLELPLSELPVDVFARLARVHPGQATYDLLTREEWLSLDAVMEIGRIDAYGEEYDDHLQHISAPDSTVPFDPAHIYRSAYGRSQRLRTGLLKLGQQTLFAALTETIPHLAKPIERPASRTTKDTSESVDRKNSKLERSHARSKTSGGDGLGES